MIKRFTCTRYKDDSHTHTHADEEDMLSTLAWSRLMLGTDRAGKGSLVQMVQMILDDRTQRQTDRQTD